VVLSVLEIVGKYLSTFTISYIGKNCSFFSSLINSSSLSSNSGNSGSSGSGASSSAI
jgi:hypothetical protein